MSMQLSEDVVFLKGKAFEFRISVLLMSKHISHHFCGVINPKIINCSIHFEIFKKKIFDRSTF